MDIQSAEVKMMIVNGVPPHLVDGLLKYVHHHIEPGDYLMAVLQNDLRGAFMTADDRSRAGMFETVRWLWNNVPAAAWGSREAVARWLEKKSE